MGSEHAALWWDVPQRHSAGITALRQTHMDPNCLQPACGTPSPQANPTSNTQTHIQRVILTVTVKVMLTVMVMVKVMVMLKVMVMVCLELWLGLRLGL